MARAANTRRRGWDEGRCRKFHLKGKCRKAVQTWLRMQSPEDVDGQLKTPFGEMNLGQVL
jgi:hypothetical protein